MTDASSTGRSDKIEDKGAHATPSSDRRGFLKKATLGLAAGASAAAVGPLLSPLITPLTVDCMKLVGTEIDTGPLNSFSEVPRKVPVAVMRWDGWTKTEKEVVGAVYIRKDGEALTAFSSICPHASCSVSLDSSDSRYVCPCHNSYFKLTGEIDEGPSHRSLDTLPVRVEKGRVFVTYKRFRPGIPTKEEV
jgi:menaquinol-cytochrome c reductase iron-sulfur subunit